MTTYEKDDPITAIVYYGNHEVEAIRIYNLFKDARDSCKIIDFIQLELKSKVQITDVAFKREYQDHDLNALYDFSNTFYTVSIGGIIC